MGRIAALGLKYNGGPLCGPFPIFSKHPEFGEFTQKLIRYSTFQSEYPSNKYPTFVFGPSYILGRNAADRLLFYAPSTNFLWLEDVFFTGLVAETGNVKHVNIQKLFTYRRYNLYNRRFNNIFLHSMTEKSMLSTWRFIMKYRKTF